MDPDQIYNQGEDTGAYYGSKGIGMPTKLGLAGLGAVGGALGGGIDGLLTGSLVGYPHEALLDLVNFLRHDPRRHRAPFIMRGAQRVGKDAGLGMLVGGGIGAGMGTLNGMRSANTLDDFTRLNEDIDAGRYTT